MPTPVLQPFLTRLVPLTPAQAWDALETVSCIVTSTGEMTLGMPNPLEASAVVADTPRVPTEIRMGLRRVHGFIEITPWSDAATELLLRPVWRKRSVPAAYVIDRYYAIAHEAMDQLVFNLELAHMHSAA